ncbi:PRC-barrel domain-containing protein [Paracoccus yeei]|jgi:hypothetical protein|uniref:PRC-barrel domain-containing protein n=1 Tax=Paracoccus yeei TaxID=147645 RepID=UPI003BF777A5
MTKLLASTALIAMLAGPALAQTATDTTTTPGTAAPATTAPATTAPDAATTTAPMDAEAPAATTAAPDATATATAPAAGFGYTAAAGDLSAETFIGKRLYAAETDVDPNATVNAAGDDWDDIGEISDLVLSKDGKVEAVLVDIGGFLGMGEKSVAVAMDQLHIIRDGDSENDYFIVFNANRAALENAPAFEWADM